MNAQEFKQRFMPFHQRLYKVAYFLAGNVEDAEDLLQDTYLKLWQKRNTLGDGAQNINYLATIMRNIYVDQQRLLKNSATHDVDETLEPPDGVSLQARIEASDSLRQLEHLIGSLPPREQQVMRKYALEQQTYDEIQHNTGLASSNIRQIVSRTKRRLKQFFIELTH